MKNIKIQIPNMQSTHCQMRVNHALKTVDGLIIHSIEPGIAHISVTKESQQSNAIAAIENAGYNIQQVESNSHSDVNGETFKFKTNINCSGCVASITPVLNSKEEISHWEVDTNNKEKILTVNSRGISKQEIITEVKNAGFNIEWINS